MIIPFYSTHEANVVLAEDDLQQTERSFNQDWSHQHLIIEHKCLLPKMSRAAWACNRATPKSPETQGSGRQSNLIELKRQFYLNRIL